MAYAPQPGTAAYRIVSWLEAQGRTKEFNSSQIAYALHLDTKGLPAQLAPALQAGLVFRRQKDSTHPRAPFWYSLTNHGVRQREFTPNPVGWMPAPKKDSTAGPPASDGAASEGTAVTPGPSQPEAAPDTPQGDQPRSERGREVMEPEACERAAGRGTTGAPALATLPQHASPGVGPMGAGQPADAGPTTDDQRSGGVDGHAAANEARAYSKAIPTALDTIPSKRPEGVPPGETQSQGSRAAGVESGTLHQSAAQQGNLNPVTDAVEPAAPAALPLQEERREVDAQFAATLRAAMNVDVDDDCLARGAELGRRQDRLPSADLAATRRAVLAPHEPAPLAFRAARFTDGSLATERDGMVVAVYSAAEVDAIQKLLGVRG